MTTDLIVATTILYQLGGKRFTAMTGAKNYMGDNNSLSFSLPGSSTKGGINKVRITLNSDDLYDIEFMKFKRKTLSCDVVKKVDNIYVDMLEEVFEDTTGLYTRL